MQKTASLLVACIWSLAATAQFSKTVKDSVAAQMYYASPRYEITLGMNPGDYAPAGDTAAPADALQLANSLKGQYKDAPALATLSFLALEKEKNLAKANEYLTKAIQQYETWVNAEPDNPEPIVKLAGLALSSKNYQLAPKVLDYGLQVFPRHLPLLHTAVQYYTLFTNELATAQVYADQALQIDSLNVTTLVWQTMLFKAHFIARLQRTGAATVRPDFALERALQRHPDNTAFQHLAWFRQLIAVFFEALTRSTRTQSDDINVFEYTGITPAENELLEKAKIWFQEQGNRRGITVATAMNTLGVIACLQRNYEHAGGLFYSAYKANTSGHNNPAMGSAILCRMFLKDYTGAASLLEEKTGATGDAQDYGALLKIYQRYLPNQQKQQQILKRVEALPAGAPGREVLLAAGFMITGNWQQSLPLLEQLKGNDLDTHIIKAGLAVIHDDRTTALASLTKALAIDPADATALKIKQLAGL